MTQRLLIVEDEPIVAEHIKMTVSKWDYEVIVAVPSGEEALGVLKEHTPDAILMDVMLNGELDGIETAREIRKEYNIPVIYLTAFNDDEILQRAELTEPYAYILKPFHERELRINLAIALQKHRLEQELQMERASLASRVEERTAELVEANERLQQEILERQHIEAELQRAKDRAEAATQAKSEFLANMSHELRTPLNAILGYAQILGKETNLTERQREGLETIRNSGEHLLTLINEVLDLAKIEAGRMELDIQDCILPDFLDHIAKIIRIRAEQKGISFRYEREPDLPDGIQTDKKRLREVLINLLDNAIKFTQQGEVSFRVSGGHLQTCRRPITFDIEDTGIGIASENLEDIFMPFQQTATSRELHIEGTGLGLVICRDLVSLLGGTLQVESTLGQGSRFWFDLEFREISLRQSHEPPAERNIRGYQGRRRRILVVDDRPENRAILVGMLLPLGFEIMEASDGEACVALTVKRHPDLIFLDLRMPVLDGFGATRQIRELEQEHTDQATVIIAVSASVFEETRQRALRTGFNDFLIKPIALERLLELLRHHLHLQWISDDANAQESNFEQTSTEVLPEVPIAPADLDILLQLVSKGRIKKFLQHIERLSHEERRNQRFFQAIAYLAKRFRTKELLTRLQELKDCS